MNRILDARRPLGRFFCCLISLLVALVAADASGPATTSVTDTVYRADGTPAGGTLVIAWQAFTSSEGKAVAAGVKTVKIGPAGAVTIPLVPNFGATPAGGYYKVTYKLDDGSTSEEFWSVPAAPAATISAIRSKLVPANVAVQYATRQYVDSMLANMGGGGSGNAVKIQGKDVEAVEPARGQSLTFDGTKYKPQSHAVVDVVRDCGAVGDGVTNDAPAIQACINANPGKTIHFPKTRSWGQADYYLAATLVVPIHNTVLEGEGGGLNDGTVLQFASNTSGLRLNGQGDVVRDLSVRGGDPWNTWDFATYTFSGTADGIQLASGQAVLDHVYVYGFNRHGVNADSAAFAGNSNLWKLTNVTSESNRGDGFHFHGMDANAGRCDMCNARLNQGWGFFDDALLPNTYIAPHTEANHDDVQNPASTVALTSLVRANHVVTATTASAHNLMNGDTLVVAGATNATFNGKRVNGVTVTDPTHFTFVDPQSDASCSGACAAAATVGYQAGNRIWVQNAKSGGPYYMPKNNTLIGAYAEGNQPWSSFYSNTLILGFNDGAGQDWTKIPNLQWNGHSTPLTFSRILRGGGYARTRFTAGVKLTSQADPYTDAAEGAFGVSNEDADNGAIYSRLSFQRTALGNTPGWWCFTADFAGTEGTSRNASPLCMADLLTNSPAGLVTLFPTGFGYGDPAAPRFQMVGALSAPADASGGVGDVSLTSQPLWYGRSFWGWLKGQDAKYYPFAPMSGCQGSWFCFFAPYKNSDGLPAFTLNTSGTHYGALYDPGDAGGGAVALGFATSMTSLPASPTWKCAQTGVCTFAGQIVSTVATGSAPLSVTSTTPVANLTLASDAQLPTITAAGKVAATALPDAQRKRICEVHIGSAGGSALTDGDDEPASCLNDYGASLTISGVRCYADAGSPTVQLARNDSTNILSGNLACGTASWAPADGQSGRPSISANSLANGQWLDVNIVSAGGTAKFLRVVVTMVQ
ncbi:MAG: glycoside hydrolase family 55 protein [Acidobacteriia bacterium]|nr:glycoside hydrolase family 55 protein [Terriglobia bacterium]